MGCPITDKYVGRRATLEIAFLCPTGDISGANFLPIGATTTKSFDMSANETSVYADDSGGFDDQVIVNSTFAFSVEGYSRASDGTDSNQSMFFQYYFDALVASEQPIVLVRYTWPDKTLTAFMNINAFTRSDPVDDKSAFTTGFSIAPSSAYRPTLVNTPSV